MHWYHTIGLFSVGLLEELPGVGHTGLPELAGGLFQGGLFLFCSGLYVRVLSGRVPVAREAIEPPKHGLSTDAVGVQILYLPLANDTWRQENGSGI